ncbi:hypothetical protein [Deinococcus marmoris]|uniref:Uncharacterized protein n=1 Tax=Deinococcus marmoris TaxID=249408 RepID=A0A1U7P2A1_9DEIO|nr:hypothetical protein [Deinococcus marmoris]OLV19286.1 hypothetical protein BOO71_0003040 [Deinococcus marmoris]
MTRESPEVVKIQVREEALPPQEPETRGPAPIGTLVVVAVVVLSIIWLWMLVLGIQQGRA